MSFFKDFSGSLLESAKTGGDTGGLDAGNLANTALDAAASAIPFGSTIKDILDSLGLQENINLVSQYGLSSWGASGSPEKAKQQFAENALPTVIGLIEQIKENPGTLDSTLDALHGLLTINMAYHKYRIGKSRAKSTKLGHEYSVKEYKNLIDKMFPEFINQFRKIGVKITKKPWNVQAHELPLNSYLAVTKQPFDQTFGAQFYQFDVDLSGAKVETNEQGQIVKKSSGGMVSMLALAGFAIFKFMK